MLTFVGEPLLFPGDLGMDTPQHPKLPIKIWRQLEEWLEYHHSLSDLSQFGDSEARILSARHACRSRFEQNKGLGLPVLNWPDPPPPRLNTLFWPTGASRWARGWFVITDKTATKLETKLRSLTGFKAGTLGFGDDGDGTVDTPVIGLNMYMLPPRLISHTSNNDVGDLYLLPLVDERYFWQYKNFGDNTVTTSTTWANLFTTLGTQLGVTINATPTVASAYMKPDPTDFSRRFDNAALLLDAAAWSCGRRVVRKFDDSVTVQRTNEASSVLNANLDLPLRRLAGGDFSRFGGDQPNKLLVTFRKIKQYLLRSDNKLYTVEKVAPDGTRTAYNRQLTIHCAAYADYNTSDVLQNGTALGTLAGQIRDDFYAWADEDYDTTYAGIVSWTPSGFDDGVLWRIGALCEGERQYQTRVNTLPSNFYSELHLASDPSKEIVEPRQLGKPVADIEPGMSGDAKLWNGTAGAEVQISPAKTVKVFNRGSATLNMDRFAWLEGINDAQWYGGCYES